MKLQETLDWNKMAGATPQKSRQGTSFTIRLGFLPNSSPDDIQGEIEDLKMRIQDLVEDAINDGTTVISGISFD